MKFGDKKTGVLFRCQLRLAKFQLGVIACWFILCKEIKITQEGSDMNKLYLVHPENYNKNSRLKKLEENIYEICDHTFLVHYFNQASTETTTFPLTVAQAQGNSFAHKPEPLVLQELRVAMVRRKVQEAPLGSAAFIYRVGEPRTDIIVEVKFVIALASLENGNADPKFYS